MVLKKSKFGGNTGNTLRKSSKGGYKTSATAAFISKQSFDMKSEFMSNNESPKVEWLENGMQSRKNRNSLNSSKDVRFSLNKDKKWLLADKLRHEILVESHKEKLMPQPLSKKSHKHKVVENHARVAIIEKVTSWSQHTSLHHESLAVKSFINSVDVGSNRKSKSWKGQINIPIGIEGSMDVTYTIETSVDRKSWPYHSDRSEFYCKVQNKCSGKFDNFKDMECYDDYVYDDADEEEENEMCDDVKSYTHKAVSLDMFIKSKNNKKDRYNYNNSIVDIPKNVDSAVETRFEKGSYILIDNPNEHFEINVIQKETDVSEVEVEDTIPSNSNTVRHSSSEKTYKEVECKVNRDEISSEYLAKRFGQSYLEGRCTPRRFIIFNENFNCDGIIVSVRVLIGGGKVSTINMKVMNISNDFLLCMEELFQQDVLNFEFLIDSCFPKDTNVIKISNTLKTTYFDKTAIEKTFKPNADIIRMNDICRDLFAQKFNYASTYYSNCYPAVCPKCYSVDTLTCMNDCLYYACDACWRMYINTKISCGCYNILCPEMACEQKIDNVTILSFLDYTLVTRFIQKHCELHIQRTSDVKFCPSGDCSMVAVCKTSCSFEKLGRKSMGKSRSNAIANIPCVHCDCNFSWCFDCQQSDHWPSSCFANETYQLQRKKVYNILYDKNGNVNETEVLYRSCPICKNPIMKSGGGNRMSYLCGNQFCWNCLRGYKDHADPCTSTEDDVMVTFSSLDIFARGSKQLRMQRKAIEFSSSEKQVSSLRRKLKLNKIYRKHQYADHQSNGLVITASKAVTLLVSGYKLLENLSAANAVCKSRHTSGRIMKFVDMFSFLLGLLYTSVNVSCLNKIKIADVMKNIQLVESSLDNLSVIGFGKK